MKKVESTIHQHKVEEVKNTLQEKGVNGMTITEVRFVGGETRTVTYRGITKSVDAIPSVRVEAIVSDDKAEAVIEAILRHARTGTAGDGTIVVSDIDRVIRIRTGEMEASEAGITRKQVASVVVPGDQSRWDVPSYQHSW